jgi:hypothetical protein
VLTGESWPGGYGETVADPRSHSRGEGHAEGAVHRLAGDIPDPPA